MTMREERKREKKKRRREEGGDSEISNKDGNNDDGAVASSSSTRKCAVKKWHFSFDYQHVMAPMVGASELAFRLLCRKYGTTLAYTPMMIASEFVKEAAGIAATLPKREEGDGMEDHSYVANSNICEFQTIPQDRPLVCHFAANDPSDFARAAKLVESHCDAIDLNLGCPQRTAYIGHFGSYLLDGDDDRKLILDIVRAGTEAVSIPIFVKIRLLDTIEETIKLCHQLRDAGAALIAIHARYRASWERTSAGAREGPALLDQIGIVKRSMPDFPILSNGNVITFDDVMSNIQLTGADGVMSAEGILDDPALFLPRHGNVNDDGDCVIPIPIYSPLRQCNDRESATAGGGGGGEGKETAIHKLRKKLQKIEAIEKKVKEVGEEGISNDHRS